MRYLLLAAAFSLSGCWAPRSTISPETGEIHSTFQIQGGPRTTNRVYELTRTTFTRPQVIRTSWSSAWAALPAVYERLGMNGSVLNPDENLFGFRHVRAFRSLGDTRMSRLVNCGHQLIGDSGSLEIQLTVMTILEPAGAGSTVRTWVDATARDQSGSGTAPVQCASTGWLEREIARGLSTAPAAG
jgi:hypothetical protein